MGVAAIIQARMGSSRLPGKTLAPLGDSHVLDWVVRRAASARTIDDVIVATTTESVDDAIELHCLDNGVSCVRGHPIDVLGRYVQAASCTAADTIVRITADCPFVDAPIIDAAVGELADPGVDYASTSLDGRYPRGLDVEAFTRTALLLANAEAADPAEREHVTLHIYRHTERFVCRPVTAPRWARRSDLRFTVDEEADLRVVQLIVDGTSSTPESLTGQAIVDFLDAHPDVAVLNRSVEHRNVR